MKNFFLSAVFIALCCVGSAQTPKTNSTKKNPNDSTTKIPLKQEKVWPVNDGRSKSVNSIIINPPVTVITWRKL